MALNGQFPSTMLAYLGWPEADHLQLVPSAAASLTRLAAKFEAAFGKPLYITDAYRTLAVQKALKVSKGKFAAAPGTSNHGLGLAIDMASRINVDGSAEHLWMMTHGPSFGWINPWWATDWNPTNGQHEPWHWEWDYRLDQSAFAQAAPIAATTPTTEDDMSAFAETQIAEIHAMLGAGGAVGQRVEDTIGYRVRDVQMALTNTLPVLLGAASRQGIDPAQITAAVVAAIPKDIAQDVLDGLAARLRA